MIGSKHLGLYLAVLAVGLFSLFPIGYVAFQSIFPGRAVLSLGLDPLTLFSSLLFEKHYDSFFFNSLLISSLTALLTLALTVPAAYSNVRWKGGNAVVALLLGSWFIPQYAIVMPLYVWFVRLRIQDTYAGLILVYAFLNMPIAYVLLRYFFATFNFEIEESALCDGCSHRGAFVRIVLPLMREGLIVVAVICFILSWNELPFAMFLTDTRAVPFTVSLLSLYYSDRALSTGTEVVGNIQLLADAIFLQMILAILLVLVLQRSFRKAVRFF
jgi:multiple sugar transport system permease protein